MAISKTNGVWIEDRKLFVKTASFDQKRKELLKHNPNKNASENIAIKKRASHIQGINLMVELTPGACRKRRRRHINNLFKVQEELDQHLENSVDVKDSSSSLSSEENIISNSVLGEEIRGTIKVGETLGFNFKKNDEFVLKRMIELEAKEYSLMSERERGRDN
ncbi:hypothetical protein RHGRI_037200 [Rhododendron griersonianum]|uniref:Uncharacterized protein n=1 Tax=Rhododendron griersonianum TaxID=479676 RepID=A0AAV6HRX7_9ERIC|nr:hypothetical protein RHGRI_037200 [Rhododendron griersonianum]